MIYNKTGNWKMYWGVMPLPQGAKALGTITRNDEIIAGALILLSSGIYVQGNAGGIRSLPQDEVKKLIASSEIS